MKDFYKKRLLDKTSEFRLLDDAYMTVFFDGHIPETELVLKIILNKKNLKVKSVKTQNLIPNIQGRSAILDILATDSENRIYNIEVQRDSKKAGPKRARYHSSLIDARQLMPKQDFDSLPETYVIFITEHDALKKGKPIYHIDRIIGETGDAFNDQAHIIYVNAEDKSDSALGLLMADFREQEPKNMHYRQLAERSRYLKQFEEGRMEMSPVIEEILKEYGEELTLEKARNLLGMEVNEQIVADALNLPIEKVIEMKRSDKVV